MCQGSKSSPRSIWPNHLLPGMHIKIGVRAQNSQILSQGTCAKIPVEIFNWVQAPVNGDSLIRMLIKLSFLLQLEPCDSNPVLQPWGRLFPLTLHWLPPPTSQRGLLADICANREGCILGSLPKVFNPDGFMAFESWSDLELHKVWAWILALITVTLRHRSSVHWV